MTAHKARFIRSAYGGRWCRCNRVRRMAAAPSGYFVRAQARLRRRALRRATLMAKSANARLPAPPSPRAPEALATLQPPLPAGGWLSAVAPTPPVPVAVSAGGEAGDALPAGAVDEPPVASPVASAGGGGITSSSVVATVMPS